MDDWIPYRRDLPRTREVVTIATMTGRTREQVTIFLLDFWLWCRGQTHNGKIVGLRVHHLPTVQAGTDTRFWDAVIEVGWLQDIKDGIAIPKFEKWILRGGKGKRERKAKVAPGPATPQGVLDCQEFRAWWELWIQHRAEIRHKLTDTTARSQLKKLEEMGLERALAALKHSITNGYQGIFEPKPDPKAKSLPPGLPGSPDHEEIRRRMLERRKKAAEERAQSVRFTKPGETHGP